MVRGRVLLVALLCVATDVGAGELFMRVLDHPAVTDLAAFRARGDDLRNCVLRRLDLRGEGDRLGKARVTGALVLGCALPSEAVGEALRRGGATVFGAPDGLPYDPFRASPYTPEELAAADEAGRSLDRRIVEHAGRTGAVTPHPGEALCRACHDQAMDEALHRLLAERAGVPVVGIMGGHGIGRSRLAYRRCAVAAWLLARRGALVVSGGGSGIMEAANLGARLAPYPLAELRAALRLLAGAPDPHAPDHRARALDVLRRWPRAGESLALSTFAYGADDDNPFATFVFKYFVDAVREDRLLGIARGGVLFAPGSAGTVQEVFQDGAQNHYRSYGRRSPMAFLDRRFWAEETLVWPAVHRMAEGKGWGDLLLLDDRPSRLVAFLMAFSRAR